jgi:hypothetical protein
MERECLRTGYRGEYSGVSEISSWAGEGCIMKSFILVTCTHEILSGSRHGQMRNAYRILVGKMKVTDDLKEVGLDRK